jgi:hypothetical protein
MNNRKKSKRVFAIVICALMAVSCLSITASAKNTTFSFSSVSAGKGSYGYWATKDDYEQNAYINPSTITGSFRLYAVDKSGTKVSAAKVISTKGNRSYSYTTYSPKKVTRGVAAYNMGNSSAKISGKWCP